MQTFAINNSILDEKNQIIVKKYLQDVNLIGKANYSFLIWDIYDAELYSNKNKFNPDKFIVALKYNRQINKDRLVNETIEDIKEQKNINIAKYDSWKKLLNSVYKSTEKGKIFLAVKVNKSEAVFFYDGKLLHKSNDMEFNELFFNIWLRKNSKNPEFTRKLLGE